MSSSDARGDWFDVQKALDNLSIRKERKKTMPKTKEGMHIDEKQKKMLLDLFNAGQTFSNSYREGGIKYLYVSDVENLLDLIDDMKEGFGISPKVAEHGDHMPDHWTDHVWSDDPQAWKSKG
jgi:hypothetical protein